MAEPKGKRPAAPAAADSAAADARPIEEDTGPVEVVVQKATRFSREYLATVISLVSTAFGVVAALAWNSAIQGTFNRIFRSEEAETATRGQVTAQYVYAVLVTLIGVLIIVYLGRLAGRIGAQPVEFKYPGGAKKE